MSRVASQKRPVMSAVYVGPCASAFTLHYVHVYTKKVVKRLQNYTIWCKQI